MLPVHIEKKLKLFQKKEYKILQTNEETDLIEKSQEGRVKLKCKVCQESIVLEHPEQKVLPYLDTEIKGARSCADVFIYTLDKNTEKWNLHVIEFKKAINTNTMIKFHGIRIYCRKVRTDSFSSFEIFKDSVIF